MQAEPDSESISKGDAEAIVFRPSTNFRHMKKYRKGVACGGESNGTRGEEDDSPVQPPLPREPPPQSPALTPKKEVEDEEYNGEARDSEEQARPGPSGSGRRVMCRKFARGFCPHGDSCIYAHEIIVSQLPGLYIFCNDFQNSVCTHAKCRYVHATVFEKEYFYRTGYLPPHAKAHLKPEPGAAPATTEAEPVPSPAITSNNGVTVNGGTTELRTPPDSLGAAATAAINVLKRKWSDLIERPQPGPSAALHPGVGTVALPGSSDDSRPMDGFGLSAAEWQELHKLAASGSREGPHGEPVLKCRKCPIEYYKQQLASSQLDKALRSSQEFNKKLTTIRSKAGKQKMILKALMRTQGFANMLANYRGPGTRVYLDQIMHQLAATPVDENTNKTLEEMLIRWLMRKDDNETPQAPNPEPGHPPPR